MPEERVRRPETAAEHLVARVPTARPEESVAAARAALVGREFDSLDALYVIDPRRRLLGLVALTELLRAPAEATVASIMQPDPPRVLPDTDQERVAALAHAHSLSSVPVADGDGRLLGAVPAAALIDVLRREHAEDLNRLAGILRNTTHARQAIEASPFKRARDRLPWLMVGLVGATVATAVVARFERALEAKVALVFFIPAIVYLADAIGTQTEAVAVRGLSLSHRPLGQLLAGELATGILIGLALAALGLPLIWLTLGDARLALTVAASVLAAGTVATTVGLVFPWVLSRWGADPAFGSGPVATIVQDVLSLWVYFLIAMALVGS